MNNLQPVQLAQQILARLDNSDRNICTLQNDLVRAQNVQKLAGNSRATLLHLRNPQTGLVIPNCPNTVGQINILSGNLADEILQILRVPAPASLAAKREAVGCAFFN